MSSSIIAFFIVIAVALLGFAIGGTARLISDFKVSRHDKRCRSMNIWIGSILTECSCRCCKMSRKISNEDVVYRNSLEKLSEHYESLDNPNDGVYRMPEGWFL